MLLRFFFFLQTEVHGVSRGGCRVMEEYCLSIKREYHLHVNEDEWVIEAGAASRSQLEVTRLHQQGLLYRNGIQHYRKGWPSH